ncbi:MAG TPA: hypothetical protein VEP90_28380 [Methylomirabilota bacterium]|nr:hypothetical protein [Methylomirabilota bacterium]
MTRNITIPVEEVQQHIEHSIEIDFGLTGYGQNRQMEYSIWCKDCKKTLGNSVRSAV